MLLLIPPVVLIPMYVLGSGLFGTGLYKLGKSYALDWETNSSLIKILNKLDSNEIAQLLAERSITNREIVLKLLDETDSVKALSVRNKLAEATALPALPEKT